MVRCKFGCLSKVDLEDGVEIVLEPVSWGSKENEEFFNYTPYGSLKIGTINHDAAKQFVVGKEYYIDISLAE